VGLELRRVPPPQPLLARIYSPVGQPNAITVVAAWLDSPGHCANIMSADYTEFGAGTHLDTSGTRYWTLVLAAPRDR
jgi:uncharacterized protein YkwD